MTWTKADSENWFFTGTCTSFFGRSLRTEFRLKQAMKQAMKDRNTDMFNENWIKIWTFEDKPRWDSKKPFVTEISPQMINLAAFLLWSLRLSNTGPSIFEAQTDWKFSLKAWSLLGQSYLSLGSFLTGRKQKFLTFFVVGVESEKDLSAAGDETKSLVPKIFLPVEKKSRSVWQQREKTIQGCKKICLVCSNFAQLMKNRIK